MHISFLTLFPEMFSGWLEEGVISRAIKKEKILSVDFIQLRDFSENKRKDVDDSPYGGGDGMVLRADIAEKALLSVKKDDSYVVNLSPSGKVFCHTTAKALSQKKHLIFLCGRYAGFDARFTERYADINLSLGDFIMSGGELAGMIMADAIARFIPGVLGNQVSAENESFEDGLLEAPQYTQPLVFHEEKVPDVLLSGNHEKIKSYERKMQIVQTAINRPDMILLQWDKLSSAEKTLAKKIFRSQNFNF